MIFKLDKSESRMEWCAIWRLQERNVFSYSQQKPKDTERLMNNRWQPLKRLAIGSSKRAPWTIQTCGTFFIHLMYARGNFLRKNVPVLNKEYLWPVFICSPNFSFTKDNRSLAITSHRSLVMWTRLSTNKIQKLI